MAFDGGLSRHEAERLAKKTATRTGRLWGEAVSGRDRKTLSNMLRFQWALSITSNSTN